MKHPVSPVQRAGSYALLVLLFFQLLPRPLAAQSRSDEPRNSEVQPARAGKLAPDLAEKVAGLRLGREADDPQRVIIQLTPATGLNDSFGDEVSPYLKEQMLAKEVRVNTTRNAVC